MCGISGVMSLCGESIANGTLEKISQSMSVRGPDNNGYWYSNSNEIGFAHNRLSIIDPKPRSDVPMHYLQGRYTITYNGEIYNYRQLRTQLKEQGYQFVTQSDTEVVMAMYDCYGIQMLDKLRGMFSFAIWDSKKNKLFAARDPFGIKPFYYALTGRKFLFASFVKALSEQTEIPLTSCSTGWCGFLLNGSVPEPFTIYNEIKSLPAGHYLELEQNRPIVVQQYYSIYKHYSDIENSGESNQSLEDVMDALDESIKFHLVADVPVGLFLSSGIDSNLIAYFAGKQTELTGFTLDFDEFNASQKESTLASEAARRYGIEHEILNFKYKHSTDFMSRFFHAMDQPSIDGLNVWMISTSVADAGYRCVLSGIGADEVLAGYPSFTDVPRYSSVLKLIRALTKTGIPVSRLLNKIFSASQMHPKFIGFLQPDENSFFQGYQIKRNLYLKTELEEYFEIEHINQAIEQLESNQLDTQKQLNRLSNSYLKVSALEIDNYLKNQLLRDADWASMNHSLELRVPFIDRELISASAQVLTNLKRPRKRPLVAKVMQGQLPDEILSRQKTGFETPVKSWLHTDPEFKHWQKHAHLRQPDTPWARRWASEIKSRFIH